VPAEPKLGPVLHPVTHLIPPEFPLLLIVPAIALDLFWRRARDWRSGWLQALAAGAIFLVVLIAAQWPVADFLMSPAARNWFFGTHYFDYGTPHSSAYYNYRFYQFERTPMAAILGMATALVYAILSTRLGIAWGNWMQRIRR